MEIIHGLNNYCDEANVCTSNTTNSCLNTCVSYCPCLYYCIDVFSHICLIYVDIDCIIKCICPIDLSCYCHSNE